LSARVVSWVQADPFAALAPGLTVVSGPVHGGAAQMAAAMLERADREGAERMVASYIDHGQRLPHFGHSVYRNGDLVVVSPATEAKPGDRILLRSLQGELLIAELLELTPERLRVKSLSREHVVRELPLAQVQWYARIVWSGH